VNLPYAAATLGAVLIISQQVLMMTTGAHRGTAMIGVGVGDDKNLERKVRRHGNLAENAAIFIVVLALAEGMFGSGVITTLLAGVFLAARTMHMIAFSSLAGSHGVENAPRIYLKFRMFGGMLTGVSGICLGLYVFVMLTI
jgi:uncharacterized membrane protein YecN with MAPEG domain